MSVRIFGGPRDGDTVRNCGHELRSAQSSGVRVVEYVKRRRITTQGLEDVYVHTSLLAWPWSWQAPI